MHHLFILRHGDAVPGTGLHSDHARTLSDKGLRELPKSARTLADALNARTQKGDIAVLYSTAMRTKETAHILKDALTAALPAAHTLTLHPKAELYSANLATLWGIAHTASANTLIIVGHNPTVSAAGAVFSGNPAFHLSPGAWFGAALAIDDWSELGAEAAITPSAFIRPE